MARRMHTTLSRPYQRTATAVLLILHRDLHNELQAVPEGMNEESHEREISDLQRQIREVERELKARGVPFPTGYPDLAKGA